MNASPSRTNPRLYQYFEEYPERGGLFSRFARRGEEQRFQIIKSWVPDTEGLSILDVGCGDGAFLARLLHGRPVKLRLEDVVEKWSRIAHARLNDAADEVTSLAQDCRLVHDTAQFDIVLACGVFDYADDWPGFLTCLLNRSKGVLITDFPKSSTWHSRARRAWLRCHGLHLHTTDSARLRTMIEESEVIADFNELALQWVVRFRVNDRPTLS